MRNIVWIVLLSFGAFSCKVFNKLPEDKKLYGGANINVIKYDSLKGGEVKEFQTILEDAARPEPNTMLFGYPYKVAFNFFLGKKKKEKGFKEWLRGKIGEKPVFIDEQILAQNVENLNSLLNSYGYFNPKVESKLNTKKGLTYAQYQIEPNKRYKIDSVIIDVPDGTEFDEDFTRFAQDFKLPTYFDLEEIRDERAKMNSDMRNIGYYYFRPEYINILLDSTQKKDHFIGLVHPNSATPEIAKKRYQINNIYLSIDTTTVIGSQENINNLFRGLVKQDPKKRYRESIFLDAIAFRPGALFSSDLIGITNNRLLSLNNFRFMQSQFAVVNQLDSTLLDVYYNLQTNKSKTIRFETNALTRSSGLAGTQLNLVWQNNNTFKGAEVLRVGINGNFEFQVGGKRSDSKYNEVYRTGGEVSLSFPRFLAPFVKIDPEVSRVLPKTQIRLTYENFIKKGLYDLNSATASWNYAWTRGRGVEHVFRPMSFNFVKSSNLSSDFLSEIFLNPNLIHILENQFILGSGYEIAITPLKLKRSALSYRGSIDAAGTFLTVYDNLFKTSENSGTIFNEKYSQFVKLENDLRYRYDVSRDLSWANRAIVGVGVPYGNSAQLPFVRQFFVGGNNSLRAFRARGVGPGSYHDDEKTAVEQFLGNNTGDIKIELNTELRYKLTSLFGLALFVDAGNVWMYKDTYIYDDRALFSKNFVNDLAVGGGIGFRLDFSFLVFRIDVATPFRKPWHENGKKWVFDEINLGRKSWRQENVIWNFAVGLPF